MACVILNVGWPVAVMRLHPRRVALAAVAVLVVASGTAAIRNAAPLAGGHLRLAGEWTMQADATDITMSFSGFYPCVDDGYPAHVIDLQPREVHGALERFDSGIIRQLVPQGGAPSVGFVATPGWPPAATGTLADPPTVLPLGEAPGFDRPCTAGPVTAGDLYLDVVIALTTSDAQVGTLIEGLVITYESQGKRHRQAVEVLLAICGTNPSRSVCGSR